MVSRQPYNPIYFGQAQPRVLNASIRNKGILFATDSKSVSSYLDVDVEVVIQDCDIFYLRDKLILFIVAIAAINFSLQWLQLFGASKHFSAVSNAFRNFAFRNSPIEIGRMRKSNFACFARARGARAPTLHAQH